MFIKDLFIVPITALRGFDAKKSKSHIDVANNLRKVDEGAEGDNPRESRKIVATTINNIKEKNCVENLMYR